MLETKRKANLLDIVEVIEDLPEYDVKRGERGTVVEVLEDPSEAYILEFVDEDFSSRLAYWVKPDQIRTLEGFAKDLFERGLVLLDSRRLREAEGELQRAIEMKPSLLRDLHSLILKRVETTGAGQEAFDAFRFLLRIAPNYEGARVDLANTYMMRGMELAGQGEIERAIYFFDGALAVAPPAEVISRIRSDLATAYTRLGVTADSRGNYQDALEFMRLACEAEPSDLSRYNLGLAHALLADHLMANTEFEGAVENFERAIDASFINPCVLNNYGVALASKGALNLAAVEFERALRMDPHNEAINANLVMAEGSRQPAKLAFATLPISDAFRLNVAA